MALSCWPDYGLTNDVFVLVSTPLNRSTLVFLKWLTVSLPSLESSKLLYLFFSYRYRNIWATFMAFWEFCEYARLFDKSMLSLTLLCRNFILYAALYHFTLAESTLECSSKSESLSLRYLFSCRLFISLRCFRFSAICCSMRGNSSGGSARTVSA